MLLAVTTLAVRCPLFGPEPGDPVFPAPIDPGDSATVRAILDSNKLYNISVRRAINQYSQGRISILRFDSLGLNTFIFSHEFQKLDSLIGVDLSNNHITQVNVPDSLKYSTLILGIGLGKNNLSEFPIDLLKIKGLLRVDVSYNKISTISQELMNSGFRQISLEHNKLCAVTDTERIWLDSVLNNWERFQDCP